MYLKLKKEQKEDYVKVGESKACIDLQLKLCALLRVVIPLRDAVSAFQRFVNLDAQE